MQDTHKAAGYTAAMRAAIILGCLAMCAVGAALFIAGRIYGWPEIEEAGAWMTAPLWLLMGAISLTAAAGLVLAAVLRIAAAVLGRRRR